LFDAGENRASCRTAFFSGGFAQAAVQIPRQID
jgi:hypothetical protein